MMRYLLNYLMDVPGYLMLNPILRRVYLHS
jgi:hypothetical protein